MQIKFEWTPEMSVNDETIDSQHRELLKQINILLDVIFEEKEINTLRETVDFLSKYIKNHLEYEEKYMEQHMFPEIREHTEIHHKFSEKYEGFKNRMEMSGQSREMFSEVETFLGDWWVHHIGHEDKKYAQFIKENE